MVTFTPNDQKLKELILYVCFKSEQDEAFGAVKLNKLLFFADFVAYARFGTPITGQEYMALKQGPAPRRLLRLRQELIGDGRLALQKTDYFGLKQDKPVALDAPKLELFTAHEIALVDAVIEGLKGVNATEVSSKSHKLIGWRLAEEGETIPYTVALIGRREAMPKDYALLPKLEEIARRCMKEEREPSAEV